MLEFDVFRWIVVGICAGLIGFSKMGIPGAGVLVVPMLASIMPARESTGFLLPILCLADIMAILLWRKHVEWKQLIKLIPWAVVGIIAGYFCLGIISNELLMPVIGGIVLILIGVTTWRNSRLGKDKPIPTSRWFAGIMGILAGGTSMLANGAGPVMTIYLLAMRLDKKEFVGTTAWFFWTINLIKLPFSANLGLINQQSLLTDLALIPCIIVGGFLGFLLVHRIHQKLFNTVVTILAAATALYLCIRAF
jgi:hypothetical protein